jgi:hypothetical protein
LIYHWYPRISIDIFDIMGYPTGIYHRIFQDILWDIDIPGYHWYPVGYHRIS